MTANDQLAERPEAAALRIVDLLARVRSGRVRIPTFQRSFTWEGRHVRELFDSLWKGYPIGTLLLWQRAAPEARLQFGDLRVVGKAESDALWVIDGQQRITSLAASMLNPTPVPERRKSPFAIFLDLETGGVVRWTAANDLQRSWLPVDVAADGAKLNAWLYEYEAQCRNPEHHRLAQRFGAAIREYPVSIYQVRTEDSGPVREIYRRMNDSGKPLKSDDIFDALSRREPSMLDELSEQLDPSFGPLGRKLALRAVLAIDGRDVTRGAGEQVREIEDVDALRPSTTAALRRAVEFLKADVGVPLRALLPYDLELLVPAVFFHHHPHASHWSRVRLARWVWRGATSLEHQRGGNSPAVREVLRAARLPDEEAAVAGIVASLTATAFPTDLEFRTELRGARSRLGSLALLALRPRDLRTGEELLASELKAETGDLEVRRIINRRPDTTSADLYVSLANRALHPRVDGVGLARLLTDERVSPAWAASHGVDAEARHALRDRDHARFLRRRGELLEQHAIAWLRAQARWEQPDRPLLSSLLLPDVAEAS